MAGVAKSYQTTPSFKLGVLFVIVATCFKLNQTFPKWLSFEL